jgi:hypothetical protein
VLDARASHSGIDAQLAPIRLSITNRVRTLVYLVVCCLGLFYITWVFLVSFCPHVDRVPSLTRHLLIYSCFDCMCSESILSVLKEATQLEYYRLRAAICEHLLEPIYHITGEEDEDDDDAFLTEEFRQATIRDCAAFLNKEYPAQYVKQLDVAGLPESSSTTPSLSLKAPSSSSPVSSSIPARIQNPKFPLMTHIGIWLLQDELWRVAELVRLMEKTSNLDGLLKDEAYNHVWQYLLRQGLLFLDGNRHSTPGYAQKRELLYTTIASGMATYGRESMMDFYQLVVDKVWKHPDATMAERRYVLLAGQHSVLRLLLKCKGLGAATIDYFITRTKWPIPLSLTHGGHTSTTDLEGWAADFLRLPNPIPASLVQDDTQRVDLERFVEEPIPTSITVAAAIVENEEPAPPPPLQEAERMAEAAAEPTIELLDDDDGDEEEAEEEVPVDEQAESYDYEQEEEEEEEEEIEVEDEEDDDQDIVIDMFIESEDEEEDPERLIESEDEVEKIVIDTEEDDDDEVEEIVIESEDEEDDDAEEVVIDVDSDETVEMEEQQEGEVTEDDHDDDDDEDAQEVDADISADEGQELPIPIIDEDEPQDEEGQTTLSFDYDAPLAEQQEVDEEPSPLPPILETGVFEDEEVVREEEDAQADAAQVIDALQGALAAAMPADQEAAPSASDAGMERSSPKREEEALSVGPEPESPERATTKTGDSEDTPVDVERLDSSPGKSVPEVEEVEPNVEAPSNSEPVQPMEEEEEHIEVLSDTEHARTIDDDEHQSMVGNFSKDDDNVDSNGTDDEQERVQEVEKADTEVAAAGREFGDTTEEEDDGVTTSGRANLLAQADRRADALRATTGYASQLEEGYEPEDTHGYTEEEVSEAIHTEDEEEERRAAAQNSHAINVNAAHRKEVDQVEHSMPHSSDDMDAADEHTDEHTEHEEDPDLGAESSEIEESTSVRQYEYSSEEDQKRDPTTLLEFAQSAQRAHSSHRSKVPSPPKQTLSLPVPQHGTREESVAAAAEEEHSLEGKPRALSIDKSVGFVDPAVEERGEEPKGHAPEASTSQDPKELPEESDMALTLAEMERVVEALIPADEAEKQEEVCAEVAMEDPDDAPAIEDVAEETKESAPIDEAPKEEAIVETVDILVEEENLVPVEDLKEAESVDVIGSEEVAVEDDEKASRAADDDDDNEAEPNVAEETKEEVAEQEAEDRMSTEEIDESSIKEDNEADMIVEEESKEEEIAEGKPEDDMDTEDIDESNNMEGSVVEPEDMVDGKKEEDVLDTGPDDAMDAEEVDVSSKQDEPDPADEGASQEADVEDAEGPEESPEKEGDVETEPPQAPVPSATEIASEATPSEDKAATPSLRKSGRKKKAKKAFDEEGESDDEEKAPSKEVDANELDDEENADEEERVDYEGFVNKDADLESVVSSIASSPGRSTRRRKDLVPATPTARRSTRKKEAADDDSVVSSAAGTRRSGRRKPEDDRDKSEAQEDNDEDSVVSEPVKPRSSQRGIKPKPAARTTRKSSRRKAQEESEAEEEKGQGAESEDQEESDEESMATEVAKTRNSSRGKKQGDEEEAEETPQPRKRGRLPKKQGDDASVATTTSRRSTRAKDKADEEEETPQPRRRGRLPKKQDEDASVATTNSKRSTPAKKKADEEEEEETPQPRRRGRLPKKQDEDASVATTNSKRSTPAKKKADEEEEEETPQPRKRGRLPKKQDDDASVATTTSRRSTRAKNKADEEEEEETPQPRKRGRLPKKQNDDASVATTSSRRSTRSARAKKDPDDDEEEKPQTPKQDDDESVATTSSRKSTRSSQAKKEDDDDEEEEQKPRKSERTPKVGRPPLPPKPTRVSARAKKKKNLG